MTLRYSKAAEDDLLNILIEGILKFGEAAAERYSNKLQASLNFIEHNPEAVRERHELSPAVRVHRSGVHMIIYMIEEGEPFIIRVRHSREDWQDDPLSSPIILGHLLVEFLGRVGACLRPGAGGPGCTA